MPVGAQVESKSGRLWCETLRTGSFDDGAFAATRGALAIIDLVGDTLLSRRCPFLR